MSSNVVSARMHPFTFQPSPDSKDAAILKIDAEIQSLMDQVRRLKSQRNALTSLTYTLPAEILSNIFMAVQADSTARPSCDFEEVLEEWLVITHVSQHWRTVALGCSSLWCEINDTVPAAFVREFLARSKGRSLSVDLEETLLSGLQGAETANLLSSIFAETFRIQTLRIETSWRNSFTAIHPYISSVPAPKLRELRISDDRPFYDTTDLRGTLFHGTTPRLTVLTLYNCQINLTSPLLMNDLTTLDVCQCFAGSTLDWLRVLKTMPRLSSLTLKQSFTDEIQGAAGTYTPIPKDFAVVSLPQLSQLIIHGPWLEADLDFLAHLRFPFQTQLTFSSDLSISVPNQTELSQFPLAAFLKVHSESRCDSSKIKIDKVQLKRSTRRVEHVEQDEEAIPKTSIALLIHSGPVLLLDLRLGGLEKTHCGEAHIAEILSLPTISHITSFTTNLGEDEDIWRRFSRWFSRLQEICVLGAADTLLTVLHDTVEGEAVFSNPEGDVDVDTTDAMVLEPDTISKKSLPFKSLKSIHIEGESIPSFQDALIKALRSRLAEGLPIKEIRLSHCSGLTDSFSKLLEKLVEDVHYDKCVRSGPGRRVIVRKSED